MKRVFLYLFILLTTLSLSGGAQAVPTTRSLLPSPVFENYSGLSANGVPNIPMLGTSWNPGGEPDRFFFEDYVDLESEKRSFNASLSIGVRSYYQESFPTNNPSCDNVFDSGPGNEGYPSGVPEPDTMMLLGSGLLVLAGIGRRFTRT
ncbi:MAG: PEP-CTERM sorting domain-containing protein [Desulfobacterales bacterium]|nr:PEP-CTERM sorting domain-containing protein [Desulfobacterales bacterium]